MNDFKVLDAAWRRWKRGWISERSPAPAYGDALRKEQRWKAKKTGEKPVSPRGARVDP